METPKELAKRLSEILLEGKWVIGTNFKEQIVDLDWKTAIKKEKELNSISQLTFHVHYYIKGVLDFFKGGELSIKDEYSFIMPPIRSEEDWRMLVKHFINHSKELITLVESFSENDLERIFVLETYGNYRRNINVLIEHSYYHLGQVILLKKLLKGK